MTAPLPQTGLQLRSLIRRTGDGGELELSLADVPLTMPAVDEVLVRIEAAPINPSDLALLFGAADIGTARSSGTTGHPVVKATVGEQAMRNMAARLGESMPVGNEGAGVVLAAGSSAAARALLGKTVAMAAGAMHAQYRTVKASQCIVLPAGTTPAEGASCVVNPLTALSMVEAMRREGHKALVHTAAASNLGQMLNKVCLKDGVALVNIVRKPEQAALLREIGARHVVDSSSPAFMKELIDALAATGATIAFDAIGGGKLAGQILTAMEAAINLSAKEYSRYGSTVHKQVYIYGALDRSPTELSRNFGMAWGVNGWLVTPFLQKIGQEAAQKLRERVASELKTTFASRYTAQISLAEALQLDVLRAYAKQATGEKYLICPHKKL